MDEREKALSSFRWFETQRLLFVLTFLAGAVGIVVIRELGFHVLYAIGFSVFLMMVYVALGATKKYFVRTDILGDNTYYLGFLFTLVSLAYTLYRYESGHAQVALIIQNFGLALSTTLFGLLGRVYFSQTREDPALYQAAVRISLAEQAANLIGETAQIRSDLSVLRVSIRQSVEEGTKTALESFGAALSDETKQFRDQLVRVTTTVEAATSRSLERFSSSVATVNSAVEAAANHYLVLMEKNAASTVGSLDSAIQNFSERSKSFCDLLEKTVLNVEPRLAEFINSIDQHDAAMKRVAGSLDQLKPVGNMLEEYLQSPLKNVGVSLQGMLDAIAQVRSAMETLSTNTGSITQQMTALANTDLTKCSQELSALSKSLQETVNTLGASVSSYSDVAIANQQCIAQLSKDILAFRDFYHGSGDEIRQASRDSLDSLMALQQSLVRVANGITNAVKEHGTR